MKPIILMAALSALLATSLTSCRSPEATQPPAPTPTITQTGKRPKLMIIGIDGTRPDAIQAASGQGGTPNLDFLVNNGAASFNALTGDISFSGPGWSSMLTGVWCDKHQVRENEFATKNLTQYPHFFVYLKQAFPGAITASISHWDKINTEIVGANPSASDHTITVQSDLDVAVQVSNILTTTDVDAIFMQFDDVDHQGHDCCYSPSHTAYVESIKTTDGHIGTVLSALASRPDYANEDWLILVSSDHGGGGFLADQHGADNPQDRTMFIFAHGPSVDPSKMPTGLQRPHILDVAVTALTHLGVTINPAWGLEGQAIAIQGAPAYVTPTVPQCGVGVGPPALDPR